MNGASVLPGLFDGLGARPLRGRTFKPEDGDAAAGSVVILSYRTWRTHFGGREDIIDSRITLDDKTTHVVGVMPESFTFPSLAGESMSRNSAGEIEDAPEFWVTGGRFERSTSKGGYTILRAHALVKPGVPYERALADVRSLIGPLPTGKVLPVELVNARVEMGRDASWPLAIFQLGMVLVLLIACANVVNLLLTRAAGRRRELAVRMALGATRGRLVHDGLAEALVLSIAGGTLGCVIAYASIAVLRTLPPHVLPRLRDIHVDGVVLGFALGLSIVTGLLVGLFSALRVARASVSSQLRPQTPYAVATLLGSRLRPSSLLVIVEIAAAVVLLTGGGLLVNSFVRLVQVDLGYDPRDIATFQVSLPNTRYPTSESRERFSRDIATNLRTLPGVEAVSTTDGAVTYSAIGFYPLSIDGKPATTEETEIRFRRVSPDYFRTLRIPVVEGREFRHDDWSPAAAKVIVNQAFARQHFPGSSPIGHHLRWAAFTDLEVIGVVADSRERPDADIDRAFYLPIETGFAGRLTVLMRAGRDAGRGPGRCAWRTRTARPAARVVRRSGPRGSVCAFGSLAEAVQFRVPLVCDRCIGPRRHRSLRRPRLFGRIAHARVRYPHRAWGRSARRQMAGASARPDHHDARPRDWLGRKLCLEPGPGLAALRHYARRPDDLRGSRDVADCHRDHRQSRALTSCDPRRSRRGAPS